MEKFSKNAEKCLIMGFYEKDYENKIVKLSIDIIFLELSNNSYLQIEKISIIEDMINIESICCKANEGERLKKLTEEETKKLRCHKFTDKKSIYFNFLRLKSKNFIYQLCLEEEGYLYLLKKEKRIIPLCEMKEHIPIAAQFQHPILLDKSDETHCHSIEFSKFLWEKCIIYVERVTFYKIGITKLTSLNIICFK